MIGVMVFSLFSQQFDIAFCTYHSNFIVRTTVYYARKHRAKLYIVNTHEL